MSGWKVFVDAQRGQDTGVSHEMQSEDIIPFCGLSKGRVEDMSAVFSSVDIARGVLLLEDPGSASTSESRLDRRDRGRGSDDGSVLKR